jgi:hypothetical protein
MLALQNFTIQLTATPLTNIIEYYGEKIMYNLGGLNQNPRKY